jgi:high-affinity Fe2+/Pb2+ permease
MNAHARTGRRPFPWVGVIVVVVIVAAILAFGVFKRKGSRIPPVPEEGISSAERSVPLFGPV